MLFQHHLVADNADDAGIVLAGTASRDNFQIDLGALGTTNLIDHFIQAQANHGGGLFVFLAHTHNAVGRLELATLGGRAGRHQTNHLGIAIFVLQHGTNALEGAAHADIEVL